MIPNKNETHFTTFANYYKNTERELYEDPMEAYIKVYLYRTDLFFFFQAEDGIRDHCVTGVQTWLFRSPRRPDAPAGRARWWVRRARRAPGRPSAHGRSAGAASSRPRGRGCARPPGPRAGRTRAARRPARPPCPSRFRSRAPAA